jgi:hypothetical protein
VLAGMAPEMLYAPEMSCAVKLSEDLRQRGNS